MSDVTTPTELTAFSTPAYGDPPELFCRDKGYDCDFHTKSSSGLQRHITIQHEQRKSKSSKPRAPKPKKQENHKPKFDLKIAWFDNGKGQALLTDQDDNWWVAKKLDI